MLATWEESDATTSGYARTDRRIPPRARMRVRSLSPSLTLPIRGGHISQVIPLRLTNPYWPVRVTQKGHAAPSGRRLLHAAAGTGIVRSNGAVTTKEHKDGHGLEEPNNF